MTQESELTKIKRKIRALAEKTVDNGASEFEAMRAMEKVGELLLQFNLTMDEVSMRDEPCVTKTFKTASKKRDVIWDVCSGIRKLCGAKTYYTPASRWSADSTIVWSFFGLESDVDMCLYLCDIISKAEDTAYSAFRKTLAYRGFDGEKRTATINFKKGFGGRINERLWALARERERAEAESAKFHQEAMRARMLEATEEAQVAAAQAKTGTALICLAKEKMVDEEFVKRGPKLRNVTHRSKARYNSEARNAGRQAGDRVNLSRPIAGGAKPAGLLS